MLLETLVVLTLLFAGNKVQADDDESGFEACKLLMNPESFRNNCCQSLQKLVLSESSTATSCEPPPPGPKGPMQCEYTECYLKEQGILQDGKINFEKAKERNDKILEVNPWAKDWMQVVHEGCTEENLAAMPDDMCLATKYEVCTIAVAMMQCPEWKEDDVCKGLASKAKECNTTLQKQKKNVY